ncbi:Gfo/Idh/MocA family oxidoreductase [candidate division KSB1 bacterium]|nr:Gfo/Idh/MocA family oxidoreductase [candidate division KSB1 bacterium]
MKNVCLVGIGGYAAKHLKILQMLEKEKAVNLHSIVVRDRNKYAKQVDELDSSGVIIYPAYQKMLTYGQDKIDIIALPIALMDLAPYAIQALENGYDVILEKPGAVTIQDADKLIQAEKASDRYLAIAYQFTYSSSISLILNTIESGDFGKVNRIKVLIGWPRGWDYYRNKNWLGKLKIENRWVLDGPLSNATSHFLNNALMILHAKNHDTAIKHVTAELYRANDIDSYDTCCLKAAMTDGAELLFVSTHAINKRIDPVMEIDTEKALISWNFIEEKTVIRYKGRNKKIFKERNTEEKYQNIFRDMVTVSSMRTRRPKATMELSRPQVLVSNLAFESAEGILTLPEEYLKTTTDKYGKKTIIKDMETIITRAYDENKLFSEIELSWAAGTKKVAAKGYANFPKSRILKKYLDETASDA